MTASENATSVARADLEKVTALKGLAILLVVGVHILTSLPSWIYTKQPELYFFTSLDQLTRFSVPLFVALSGFGFASKYRHQSLATVSFLIGQFKKLMPLYLLWSFVFLGVFYFLPWWRAAHDLGPWWGQLLLGRADYHLYFIPMVFQLYLLFPVVLLMLRRMNGWLLWLIVAIIQVIWYLVLTKIITGTITFPWLISDQHHYSLSITWLSYFVLGSVLALQAEHLVAVTRPIKKYGLIVLLGLFGVVAWRSSSLIIGGLDPLYALRFTKPILFPYATAVIIYLILVRSWWSRVSLRGKWYLALLGKWSFVVYLAHTLALRIFFGLWQQTASSTDLLIAGFGLLAGLVGSWLLLKQR